MNKMMVCGILLIGLMLIFSACGGAAVEQAAEQPAAQAPVEEAAAEEPTEEAAAEEPTEEAAAEEPTEESAAEEPMPYDISAPVVILVVDNFHVEGDNPSQPLPPPQTSGNCLVTPDGFGNYGSMDFGNYGSMDFGVVPGAPLYHGWYVKAEVDSQIRINGGQPIASTFNGDTLNFGFDWFTGVDVWQIFGDQFIIVVAVDTFNFNTDSLASILSETIERFTNNDQMQIGGLTIQPVRRFVINMSFGIVPCDPNELVDAAKYAEEIEGLSGIPEFNNLVASFANKTGVTEEDAEKIIATTMIPGIIELKVAGAYPIEYEDPTEIEFLTNDPLKSMLVNLQSKYQENTTIISVAAAGNFGNGYAYPFAPAMWDNVVSISGQDAEGRWADYSNPGEVMIDGKLVDYPDVPEATSFAAPKFSFLAAVYLLNGGGQVCDPSTNITPPMGYANDQGAWDNLNLNDAADNHCHEFPR